MIPAPSKTVAGRLRGMLRRDWPFIGRRAEGERLAGYAWIEEFIRRVRPYLFVRVEDDLLIKRPNQAVKLNHSAAVVLASLLDGMSISRLYRRLGGDERKMRQVAELITAVKAHLEGRLDPFSSPAVETIPFTLEFSRLPVLSEIALSYRCNLRCAFCYAGCNCVRRDDGAAEMSPAQVRRVIDTIIDEARVPSVSFTGGEPTLVRQLPDYIRHAKKRGMRVNLITNGTLIDAALAGRLARGGLDSAQVSIEGVSAAVHDAITGCAGSFEASVAAVRHLARQGIATHCNTTLTRLNMDECRGLPRFVKQMGCTRFSMNLMIPTGSGAVNQNIGVSYRELEPFIREMIALSAAAQVEFMWYSPVPMCLFNTITHGLGNKGCAACDGLLSVSPSGDVLPCSSCDEPVGNLLSQPFEEVWNSPRARYYHAKAFAHERCRECEDFALCNGACPLYWRTCGYGELAPVFARREDSPGNRDEEHSPMRSVL